MRKISLIAVFCMVVCGSALATASYLVGNVGNFISKQAYSAAQK